MSNKELARATYTIEGLNVINNFGKYIVYIAKDEKDLDDWLERTGQLIAEKYSENFREDY